RYRDAWDEPTMGNLSVRRADPAVTSWDGRPLPRGVLGEPERRKRSRPRARPPESWLSGRPLPATGSGGQHTVDELRRRLRAEHLRELHGLVDDHPGGRVPRDSQLVESDPEHVPIDPRHLIDGELGRELSDLRVELLAVL